jgi:hypothetical protein
MRFTWIDCESGESDINLFGANGQNDWEKGLGSALTYAERYFLLKYFHISTDEDDIDNPNRKPEQNAPQTKALPLLTTDGYNYLISKGTKEEIQKALTTRQITDIQKLELEIKLK